MTDLLLFFWCLLAPFFQGKESSSSESLLALGLATCDVPECVTRLSSSNRFMRLGFSRDEIEDKPFPFPFPLSLALGLDTESSVEITDKCRSPGPWAGDFTRDESAGDAESRRDDEDANLRFPSLIRFAAGRNSSNSLGSAVRSIGEPFLFLEKKEDIVCCP